MDNDPVDGLTEEQLRAIVRGVRDILWVRHDLEGAPLDGAAPWDSETIEYVAATLADAGLQPDDLDED